MKTTKKFTLLMILAVGINFPVVQAQDYDNGREGPKIDIKVQKETDENGNTTRLDSSYSWSWYGNGNMDSLWSAFGDQFNMDFDFSRRDAFGTNFSFDFQVPEINTNNYNFKFGDSTVALDDLEEFMEDFKSHMNKFHDLNIKIDPFESWGGEEAFREHFERNFNHEEFGKKIEGYFDSEEFQRKMEKMMKKQQEFMDKHQDLLEKYQNQKFNKEEEMIHKNRHRYHEENGTKAI